MSTGTTTIDKFNQFAMSSFHLAEKTGQALIGYLKETDRKIAKWVESKGYSPYMADIIMRAARSSLVFLACLTLPSCVNIGLMTAVAIVYIQKPELFNREAKQALYYGFGTYSALKAHVVVVRMLISPSSFGLLQVAFYSASAIFSGLEAYKLEASR